MLKHKRQIILFALLVVPFIYGTSQISFSNSNFLLPNHTFHSGVGLGISDVNGDGLSDIIHLEQGRDLFISYQNLAGNFTTTEYISMSNSSQWSMCAADVNNDGLLDILSGGFYDGVKISIANANGEYNGIISMPGDDIFTQGSNFVDINNDGYVDVFVCHDDAMSKIYGNNGDGTFSEENWIDMTTVPASDNSGNYGSVWSDFDNDGDIDLYIAKCRQGVSNPEDPRRINALYVNDGNGNFSEQAEEYGLKIGAQSWTADFGDMDNDGDLDCFITNHDTDSQILENDGTGHFTDITASTGLDIGGLPIQGIWRDFDNDGYNDIIVAGSMHSVWLNNGDKTFTEIEVFDNNEMESYAVGDLNADGFVDVMGGYANIYTNPSNIDDVIWLNDGNENNHLSVNLEGTVSNRKAIGAKIEIHGPWGIQLREVRAGESYGIMNDLQQVFGLGNHDSVDSLVVKWPSGTITTLVNVQANQTINILEQDCQQFVVDLGDEEYTICSNEEITITAPDSFSSYLWSTGDTTSSITTSAPGIYSLLVFDNEGCTGVSPNIFIQGPSQLFPSIASEDDYTNCEGVEVELSLNNSNADSIIWSNGEVNTNSIILSNEGSYTVSVFNECDDQFTSEAVELSFISVDAPIIEAETITEPGTYTFESDSDQTYWYESNPPTGDPLAIGSVFESPELMENVTYYALVVEERGIEATGGQEEIAADPIYSGSIYNGAMIFDVYDDFTLESVEVYTDSLGTREIQLIDDTGVIASTTVDITEAGWTELSLNFDIPVGEDYILTTNADVNQESFGADSPIFARSNELVSYPYPLGDLGALITSNFGTPYYYYFYNWKVKSIEEDCLSDVVEVNGIYNPDTNTEEQTANGNITLYPIPATEQLFFELNTIRKSLEKVFIIDMNGRSIPQNIGTNSGHIELGDLPSGLYQIQFIFDDQQVIQKRFIKG